MTGLVIKNTGSHYIVLTEDGVERSCLAKGNLRLRGFRSTNPIVVGDHVVIDSLAGQAEEDTLYIKDILPRKNYIIRRAANLSKESHILAANIDASFLVCTIAAPETSTTFIDRFLATAEAYRVPTELIFNKVDLYTPETLEYMEELIALYEQIGSVDTLVSGRVPSSIGSSLASTFALDRFLRPTSRVCTPRPSRR